MSDAAVRKVAFVTGASSGIGAAAAEIFARAGYAVAIVDRDEAGGMATEDKIRGLGGTAKFIACDVSLDGSVSAAVAETVATFGRLDAAFNAAGIDGEQGQTTTECSLDNWDRVIAIDLSGVFYCMRHQIPAMLESGGGAVVNCASAAGLIGAPYYSAYSAAKHGVVGLTKSAALEFARSNIRVNAVCPGMIDTPMTRGGDKEVIFDALIADSPMGRRGMPEEIAEAALWLCSERAGFVTGQAIAVDGAYTTR